MTAPSKSKPEQPKLSTQELPKIPTVQEMETWDAEKVLRWIQRRDLNILAKEDDLNNFQKAGIVGRAFLAFSVEHFETYDLPLAVAVALKDLADEVKEGDPSNRITGRKRKGDEIDAPEQSISSKRYRAPLPSSSTLVVSGELEKFPLTVSDFSEIRQPGLAYFDRTKYIPELQKTAQNVLLVCRPRRFGKSLTVSMLQYFHGFQFRNQYDELFKDLDVDKAVKDGIVQPGLYFILHFDFSRVARCDNINESTEALKREINGALSEFKLDYNEVLGESFVSETSGFTQDDPAGNLRDLVRAVNRALQGIQRRGEEGHPLRGVRAGLPDLKHTTVLYPKRTFYTRF